MTQETIRILYVDDYPLDRELVREALTYGEQGFVLSEAASRQQFETLLNQDEYDLVLTDFNILGFDGLQVLDAVRARLPRVPVVIVTGTGNEEVAVEAMKRGVADYVIKSPRHIRRLPLIIRNVLEQARLRQHKEHTEAAYRTLVQYSLQGLVMFDAGGVHYANPATAQICGYSVEKICALSVEELGAIIHPEDREALRTRMRAMLAGQSTPLRQEFRLVHRDGSLRWVEALASRVEYLDRPVLQVAFLDITERKRAEEQLKASLREKELLLREVHHRVKNNLQIISSLLDLQADYVQDDRLRAIFRESQQRVRSMALIHTELYQTGNLAHIDFAAYVRNLVSHVMVSYGAHPDRVVVDVHTVAVYLGIDMAIPLGLLANELVANAIKHAFPDERLGHICVRLEREGSLVSLVVQDDGIGLPADIDVHNPNSLGLQLVALLAHQLDGRLEVDRSRGTTFRLTCSLPDCHEEA